MVFINKELLKIRIMKCIFILTILLLSWSSAMSQEVVFEKQFETARFNESKGFSSMVESHVKSTGSSNEVWTTLIAVMGEKDGYVSVTKTSFGFIVKHESWIPFHDIVDVFTTAGAQVTNAPNELIESH